MNTYIDIHILDDPDFPSNVVLRALFNRLHLQLVDLKADTIGISFPLHTNRPANLGRLLRIHGNESALTPLHRKDWVAGVRDHIKMNEPLSVPDETQHRVVRRVQAPASNARLARRYAKRHNVEYEEALSLYESRNEEVLKLPYLHARSLSTGHSFSLFIEHGPLLKAPVSGSFSAYGLSSTGTIPWF